MFQQQVRIINNFLMLMDTISIVIAGYLAYILRRFISGDHWHIKIELLLFSVVFIIVINNYIMGQVGLYSDRRPTKWYHILFSVFKAILADFLVLGAVIFLLKETHYSRAFFVYFATFSYIFIVIERLLFQLYIDRFARKRFHARNLILVGDENRGKIVADALEKQLSWGHRILGRLVVEDENSAVKKDVIGKLEDLPKVLIKYPVDEVIFAIGGQKDIKLSKYLDICRKIGVEARILPALWSPETPAVRAETVQGVPFLTIGISQISATGLLYKRILDILGGFVGTLLFLLMYPFVAIAIKLDSPGPVLFKQKRVGQHGRVFTLYKFRTMYVDAERIKKELMDKNIMKGPMFKIENDPRITRVGRFLRKTSLDEFPQFINVLKGEMSLVGTRPPTLEEVEKYELWHWRRLSLKPGITGLWQISGRNKITDFDKIVELDCKYMENWKFRDDLKIILKTILVVLKRKGAL